MDESWTLEKKIELRNYIRSLPTAKARSEALHMLNKKPGAWNAYIGVLEIDDLPKLSEIELFMLMRSLKTGSRKIREEIAEEVGRKGIDDLAKREAEKIALHFDRVGYALLTDMENYGDRETRKTIFKYLRDETHLFTVRPIPNYMANDAANIVLIRNSNNLHEDVKNYLDVIMEVLRGKQAQQLNGVRIPKAISLQEATIVMMGYEYGSGGICMREGMIRAMVGLAYGGSPPLESKVSNGNPFPDLPLIEFTDSQWEKAKMPYPKPNLSYQGPFWVLNEKDAAGKHIAAKKFESLKNIKG